MGIQVFKFYTYQMNYTFYYFVVASIFLLMIFVLKHLLNLMSLHLPIFLFVFVIYILFLSWTQSFHVC